MKTLLVIGAGLLQVPAYEVARRLGVRTVATDRNPNAPGMRLADSSFVVDTLNIPALLTVAERERIDGVLTLCTDAPVVSVAAIAERMGLPGLSPTAALNATNKAHMRDALLAGGVPIPAYHRAWSLAEAEAAAEALGYPVILKPPASSGSRGIHKASGRTSLAAAYEHARSVARSFDPVLVEEFIDGPEVSVETLSAGGTHTVVAVTDKRTSGDPYWVEFGHVQPSRLPPTVLEAVEHCAVSALGALSIDNAAGHAELKIGPTGPRLIELGARLGGDFITTELVRRSSGVDMVASVIRMALGDAPDLRRQRTAGAAIRYFDCGRGRIVDIRGLGDAYSLPGVVRLEVLASLGDWSPGIRSSTDRPGFVICEGSDAAEAEARANAAATAVTFVTSEDPT